MAINKFFVEYEGEAGALPVTDTELGPLGYAYEYDAAYRRAKELSRSGFSRVRVIRRQRGAPEEVIAEVNP